MQQKYSGVIHAEWQIKTRQQHIASVVGVIWEGEGEQEEGSHLFTLLLPN